MFKSIPFFLAIILFSCNVDPSSSSEGSQDDFKAKVVDAIIEIPAGTLDKFELNKEKGIIEHEHKDGKPRVVQYLAYPGNYGYIPNTLLAKKDGGDGDPLDVIVLGAAVERNAKIPVRLIGVLKLIDRGEQDDKLIAVTKDSPFWKVNSMKELDKKFKGTSSIIETWFSNYKGKGKMESEGFEEQVEAYYILKLAQIK